MTPLRLELSLQCVACKGAIALNAISPSVACDICGRRIGLSVDQWRELLRAPLDELGSMRDGEQRDGAYETPDGICRRVYRREGARCAACGEALSHQAAKNAASSSGWIKCSKCERSILARALPAVAPQVGCFVGEDAELAFNQPTKPAEPVIVACPSCGGGLPVDGASRAVACKFCHATVQLPEGIWSRLHPTRPLQPFWAFLEASAATVAAPSYGVIHEGAIDAVGNVYLAADGAVYSLDPAMAPRWVRADIHVRDREFMVWPDGRLWVHGRARAEVLACDDGRTLGPGPEFPRGRFTCYAIQGASVLASAFHEEWAPASFQVQRLDLNGSPLPLFQAQPPPPKKTGLFAALFGGVDPVTPQVVRIDSMSGVKVFPAMGGDMLVLDSPNFDVQLALLTSDHRQRWRVQLPLEFPHLSDYRVFAEPDGGALVAAGKHTVVIGPDDKPIELPGVMVERDGKQTLLRVGASGATPLLPPDRMHSVVGRQTLVLLAPSGDILLFGPRGDIVRLARDGRELWRNEAAKGVAREGEIADQGN